MNLATEYRFKGDLKNALIVAKELEKEFHEDNKNEESMLPIYGELVGIYKARGEEREQNKYNRKITRVYKSNIQNPDYDEEEKESARIGLCIHYCRIEELNEAAKIAKNLKNKDLAREIPELKILFRGESQ